MKQERLNIGKAGRAVGSSPCKRQETGGLTALNAPCQLSIVNCQLSPVNCLIMS